MVRTGTAFCTMMVNTAMEGPMPRPMIASHTHRVVIDVSAWSCVISRMPKVAIVMAPASSHL